MSPEILATIFHYISLLVQIYYYGMIIYFFMSWLPNARENAFGRFLARLYEPFLEPFRKIIPPIGMFDISSIAAIIALVLFQKGLDNIFAIILNSLY